MKGVGRRGAVAGLIGGLTGILVQLLLRGAFNVGPRLADLMPDIFKPLVGSDVIIFAAFILLESVVAGFLYAQSYNRLPGKVWLKGLSFGALLWLVVNILPLLGASAMLELPSIEDITCWSLIWLFFIEIQIVATALSYQGLMRLAQKNDQVNDRKQP